MGVYKWVVVAVVILAIDLDFMSPARPKIKERYDLTKDGRKTFLFAESSH